MKFSPAHAVGLKRGSLLRQLIVVGAFLFVVAAPLCAQDHATKNANSDVATLHWRKYVSKEHGLSFWYPDTYTPTDADGGCKDNQYRRFLLCLSDADSPDSLVFVAMTVAPFHVYPGAGDLMPTRQRIGRHIFYCGMVGSMGVGFGDVCILNLRGKALEFQFTLPNGPRGSEGIKRMELTMLKTLRIF